MNSRLFPLTEKQRGIPKALLPVANRPLIAYQLQWLEEAHIHDIIVGVTADCRLKVSAYVHKIYERSAETSIKIVEVPDNCGTAETLRWMHDEIKCDFLCLSCDLVTDVPPQILINAFRLNNSTMTMLLYDPLKLEASGETIPSSKKQDEEQLSEWFAIHDDTARLLAVQPRLETDDDSIDLRCQLLAKFPLVHLYSQLRDARLYLFKKWVADFVAKDKAINSIKHDLLPILLECQYRDAVAKKTGIDKFLAANPDPLQRALDYSSSYTTSGNGTFCNAVLYGEGMTARSNTLWSFCELNRHVTRNLDRRVQDSASVSDKTQVGNDSLVGKGSRIDDKCSVKKSVIGNHCVVGRNVKITNSVIMDYVIIEDYAKIEGCIVCPNAKLGERVHLKDCEVGAKQVIQPGTISKGEVFVDGLSD